MSGAAHSPQCGLLTATVGPGSHLVPTRGRIQPQSPCNKTRHEQVLCGLGPATEGESGLLPNQSELSIADHRQCFLPLWEHGPRVLVLACEGWRGHCRAHRGRPMVQVILLTFMEPLLNLGLCLHRIILPSTPLESVWFPLCRCGN